MPEPYKVIKTYEYQETEYFSGDDVSVAVDRHAFSDTLVQEGAPEPLDQWELDEFFPDGDPNA